MSTIATGDGTQIFYKDWGSGQPVVFSHGWPLNADAWDDQAMLVANNGYRASPTTAAPMAAPANPGPAMRPCSWGDPAVSQGRLRLLQSASAAAGGSSAKPTIVLVHGAWADGSSWNQVT